MREVAASDIGPLDRISIDGGPIREVAASAMSGDRMIVLFKGGERITVPLDQVVSREVRD